MPLNIRKILFIVFCIFYISNPSFGLDSKKSPIPQFKSVTPYDSTIKKYAKHYGFDWRLILAQIKQESRFNPNARNRSGAKGLMQIMPKTAQDLKIKNILSPRENISAGIRYLRVQYSYFKEVSKPHREMFALASYNCGAGRVFDSRDLAKFELQPHDQWKGVQVSMPKLAPEYKDLHLKIWQKPYPRYGYFTGYKETITYVNKIWEYYLDYKNRII